jgi:hypothetical protein
MEKLSLKQVIQQHSKRLMKIKGVVGIAAGAKTANPKERCILIYTNVDDWPAELPHQLEGYDVEIQKASGFHIL